MAIMIPEKPRSFKPESREDIMFSALEKLPDDYYVIHSYQISKIRDQKVIDAEADFVIFNRKKGLLCLEAKATRADYRNGTWYYGYGEPMSGDGPFSQARNAMYDIRQFMKDCGLSDLVARCKFFHGVWFPLVSQSYVKSLPLTQDAPLELIMTQEALYDPEPWLERIFSYTERGKESTDLNESQAAIIVNEVLCPKFEIAPAVDFENETKRIIFHRLLKEQALILKYLEEQKTAIINGAAGTGKTLVAVEKAKSHATKGERVLFLCFNSMLKEFLSENYARENIDYYTVAGYACSVCLTGTPDYDMLCTRLFDMHDKKSFPYKHVVVDEGQDFGIDAIEEADVLETLKTIVEDTEDGSFYVFYDKLQLVQGRKMPKFLEDADCKLTLYRNCRNTENIAKTSLRPISERKPKLIENCIVGAPARMRFCNNKDEILSAVDSTLDSLLRDGFTDIVILTCKTERDSFLSDALVNGKYPAGMKSIPFTTCRKFKGLEADAIILVDVDEETFIGNDGQNVLLFYVGTSRAKLRLDIISTLDNYGASRVLESLGRPEKVKRPQRELARALNAVYKVDEE